MSLSTPNEHRAQEAKKGGAGEHPSSVRRERVPVSSGKLGALESVGGDSASRVPLADAGRASSNEGQGPKTHPRSASTGDAIYHS